MLKTPAEKKASVLIVDDDPIVLEAVGGILDRAGYQVTTRVQALGTSQWIAQHQPDYILLDVMMPALTGKDLALLLAKNELSIGIILHSSLSGPELEKVLNETKALGAIQKTGDEKKFVAQFERLTTSGRPPRADSGPLSSPAAASSPSVPATARRSR